MVDLFMDAGFTYFDTAFVYPGSEAAGEGHRASDCISCRQFELDYENGKQVYEVGFHVGKMEYDYDIDASTGDVLKYEIEQDD